MFMTGLLSVRNLKRHRAALPLGNSPINAYRARSEPWPQSRAGGPGYLKKDVSLVQAMSWHCQRHRRRPFPWRHRNLSLHKPV